MLEQFVEQRFYGKSQKRIDQANTLIAAYTAQGYVLTLRQLYYQFVVRNWIENTERSYKKLGDTISNARLAGLIDWYAIEDRVRFLSSYPRFNNVLEYMQNLHKGYGVDCWADQSYYMEVRGEKDALSGIFEKVCGRWRVPYTICRGFSSQSETYETAQRLSAAYDDGKQILVLYVGDHDPSGNDMTRDNTERLRMLSRIDNFEVKRIALNMDQIQQYKLPPQPAKVSDIRYENYAREHGKQCWEVDALEPSVIEALITAEVEAVLDRPKFDAALERERQGQEEIRSVTSRWNEIVNPPKPESFDYAW